MTEMLKKAFDEAARLPADEQDAIAMMLLAELESERQWAESFSRSQDALAKLASEAITPGAAGSALYGDGRRRGSNRNG